MARDGDRLFSVIIPSTGRRPKALAQAVRSVERAAEFAGLERDQLEILIGFDGVRGKAPACVHPIIAFNLSQDNDWGNGIRKTLMKVAAGDKLLFLDDDNSLKPAALHLFLRYFDAEMIVGRIDTQLAFDKPYLPVVDSGSLVRPGNIDPLCLCVSRRLVMDRCDGWDYCGERDADYLNIHKWYRRAQSVTVMEEVVGVYDSGRSLDNNALSPRQQDLLDSMAAERGIRVSERALFKVGSASLTLA
ncbi:glycosyltransferase [Pseudodesulfovibrio sp.]|uniref:glycosyltransferase n=1 Tax=unclassified Pseudodesulfovibrio TaxID=2661612 RepID=UPI003AFF6C46